MRISHPLRAALVTALAATAAWVATAQQPARTAAKRVVNTKALVNAAKDADEWITYGRDYAETHFSPLTQINDKNVGKLGLAWTFATDSPSGANIEATPLMHDGVLYGSLGWNVMFAVDARTGKFMWRYDPEVKREKIARSAADPSIVGLRSTTARSTKACSTVASSPLTRPTAKSSGPCRTPCPTAKPS